MSVVYIRDAPLDIRGGGQKKNEKNSLSPQKSEKKFVENVGRKLGKIVVEIFEKYVDQKKTPNGNVNKNSSPPPPPPDIKWCVPNHYTSQ